MNVDIIYKLSYMLQVESFEKIILTSYDITHVTYLMVPPINL